MSHWYLIYTVYNNSITGARYDSSRILSPRSPLDDDKHLAAQITLPAEAGSIVVKAIEAVAKPQQEARQEHFRKQRENVSAESSAAFLRSTAPEVNSKTCITHWRGEDCDYGMAIHALLRRDEGTRIPVQPETRAGISYPVEHCGGRNSPALHY